MRAIEYTIDTKMIAILEHIIEESSINYLDMHIKDDVIKKLICKSDDNTNKLILRRIWARYITLIQTDDRFEEYLGEDEDISSIVEDSGAFSILNQGMKITIEPLGF